MSDYAIDFTINSISGKARRGLMQTPHGKINSPFFMTVGTLAAVKVLLRRCLESVGVRLYWPILITFLFVREKNW